MKQALFMYLVKCVIPNLLTCELIDHNTVQVSYLNDEGTNTITVNLSQFDRACGLADKDGWSKAVIDHFRGEIIRDIIHRQWD